MLLQYIDNDCHNKILSYLCYLDRLSYKMINKTSYENIKLNFRDLFIERLMRHEVVPSYELAVQFCDKLKETGAIISGSFILDILYGTDNHRDIDLYDLSTYSNDNCVHRNDFRNKDNINHSAPTVGDFFHDFGDVRRLKFTQYLYQSDYWCVEADSTPDIRIRSYLHNSQLPKVRKDNEWIRSPYILPSIDELKLANHRHKIQVIPIGMETQIRPIQKFINATFDLEICQNYFDGEKIYLKNVNKLFSKTDFIKANTRFFFSVYIGEKDKSESNMIGRMEKYNQRGFHITKHHLYDEMKKEIDDLVNNGYEELNGGIRNFDVYKHIANGMINLSRYDS